MLFIKKNVSCSHFFWAWTGKGLSIMKYSLFFFIVGTFTAVASSSYSQTTRLTLDMQGTTVSQVLSRIEGESQFYFTYNTREINPDRVVSVQLKDADIDAILKELFAGEDIHYVISDKHVVLYKDSKNKSIESSQQALNVIKGKVSDNSGNPLPGVNVMVKGTNNGTVTGIDGNYSISIENKGVVLSFSFIGYVSQEIQIGNRTVLNVTLLEDLTNLDEVVVIGYGVQKRSNISGAITSVSSAELHTMATNNAGQALQGKVPVYITRTNGAPGAGTEIFLRGVGTMRDSSPLWIIDGVKGIPLDNFQDVESIQILKDAASTAIYGIEGANGVILVTTKGASKGRTSVNYNGYLKVNDALGLPQLLGTKEYSDMYVARWKSNNPTLDPEKSLKSFYLQSGDYYNSLPNTDWVDAMFDTGIDQVHSISVSGGTDKSDFLISILHEGDKGTYVNTKFAKTAIRLKAGQQAAKWLKFEESIDYRYTRDQPVIGSTGTTSESYVWLSLLRGNPAMNVYDDTNPMRTGYGYFSDDFMKTIDWQGNNPLESAMSADYWTKRDNVTGNFRMIVTPIKGLVWTTNLLGSLNNSRTSKFFFDNYGGNSINTQIYTLRQESKDQFTYNNSTGRRYFLSSVLDYSHTIGKNSIGIMLGAEVFESESYGAAGSVTFGIPAEVFRTTQLAPRPNVTGNNSIGSDSGYSQFGRLTYAWDNKYLMTATFRNDASTKFAPGKRQAFFPAVSIGWNIAEESFFNLSAINQLKLRYGIGESGNDDVPANLWRQEYTQNATGSLAATKVINRNITWEKTVTNNIGVDLGLFDNSFTASIDLYEKKTRDALLSVSLPNSTGFGSYYVNKGKIQNKGVELMLGYRKKINDFYFSINGNITYNENKVLDLGESSFLSGGDFNRTYEGGPVSAFYGYVADGLYQSQAEIDELNAKAVSKGFDSYDGSVSPGDIKFKDLDGDGTITSDGDMTSIGSPWPKYIYGFNFSCSYKGIDFSMNWQGVADIDVYNNTLQYTQNMFSDYNSTYDVFKAWSESNKNTSIPRLGNSTHNYGRSSSYMVEDASYLRLKNVQLGYDLSKLFSISTLGLQRFRIYMGMENALTFTKFKGFDPEFMSGNNYQRGVYGIQQYPQYRSVLFGIQLGF